MCNVTAPMLSGRHWEDLKCCLLCILWLNDLCLSDVFINYIRHFRDFKLHLIVWVSFLVEYIIKSAILYYRKYVLKFDNLFAILCELYFLFVSFINRLSCFYFALDARQHKCPLSARHLCTFLQLTTECHSHCLV